MMRRTAQIGITNCSGPSHPRCPVFFGLPHSSWPTKCDRPQQAAGCDPTVDEGTKTKNCNKWWRALAGFLSSLTPALCYDLIAVQEDDEYECASVIHSHSQDVKKVVWHPTEEVSWIFVRIRTGSPSLTCDPYIVLWQHMDMRNCMERPLVVNYSKTEWLLDKKKWPTLL